MLVVEKSPVWGGSAAMSAGAVGAEQPPHAHAGLADSDDDALRYLKAVTHGEIGEAGCGAFVTEANRMIEWLGANTPRHVHARSSTIRTTTPTSTVLRWRPSFPGARRLRRGAPGRRVPHAARPYPGNPDPRQVPHAHPRSSWVVDAGVRPKLGVAVRLRPISRPLPQVGAATGSDLVPYDGPGVDLAPARSP